jgi:hypothetical protein
MSIRIRYSCPHCNRRIVHHPELAGQLVICSACKGEFYEPTDPLPGKPAERALQPLPNEPRRLRVPEGSNPKHDLAVLAPRDASDLRTITEIIEAVLLDDNPPLPIPRSKGQPSALREETVQDLGKSSPSPAAPVAGVRLPPTRPGAASHLAGPSVHPLVPASVAPPAAIPAARPVAKPAIPIPVSPKPTADRPLAGVSVKQMAEELRHRGLGVALVTCDMNPLRNFEMVFSDNMTREDALAILRKYLDTLREVKSTEKPTLLKRMWQKGDHD